MVLKQFWRQWKGEYFLELRDAHHHYSGRTGAVPPSVGDIVLVEDDDKPSCMWRLAKVDILIVGKDGLPRGTVLHVLSHGDLSKTNTRFIPSGGTFGLEPTQFQFVCGLKLHWIRVIYSLTPFFF